MYTFYIDTHMEKIVLILFQNGHILDKREEVGKVHSSEVMPMIEDLWNKNHIDASFLSNIIVITGPGSFTGVRIGVVLAKILSYCKDIPIKALTYLEVLTIQRHDHFVGVQDRNGMFIGEFDPNALLQNDYFYLKNTELSNFKHSIVTSIPIDYELVYRYALKKEDTPSHLLCPIYVKKIDVGGILK